jgi:hypothetical protein
MRTTSGLLEGNFDGHGEEDYADNKDNIVMVNYKGDNGHQGKQGGNDDDQGNQGKDNNDDASRQPRQGG